MDIYELKDKTVRIMFTTMIILIFSLVTVACLTIIFEFFGWCGC